MVYAAQAWHPAERPDRRREPPAGTCHNAPLFQARHDRHDSYQKIERLAAWSVHPSTRRKAMTTDWRRRHAFQIASQLPDSLEDALAVLAYAQEIIERVHEGDDGGRAANVLTHGA
jgi:hypothetical protein